MPALALLPPGCPLAPDYQTVNVQAQHDDPTSMLTLYRRLCALRRATPALAVGTYTAVEAQGDVLAYMRITCWTNGSWWC